MSEKKENVFQRIRNWWDAQTPEEKAGYKGAFQGWLTGVIGFAIGYAIEDKRMAPKRQQRLENEFNAGYYMGMKDGHIQAYYDLLNKQQNYHVPEFKNEHIKHN